MATVRAAHGPCTPTLSTRSTVQLVLRYKAKGDGNFPLVK